MVRLISIIVLIQFVIVLHGQDGLLEDEPLVEYKYLALGDSYTIGTSVQYAESFPLQLSARLSANVLEDVIARNGWTTTDLLDSINIARPKMDYDLVTLLIGVNNQYQGLPFELYEIEFVRLLDLALMYVGSDPQKVVIVSIPDYAFTPFGQTRPDPSNISLEIDRYNAFAGHKALENNVHYVYITDITRKGLEDKKLVAYDSLHPSGLAYKRIVERLIKVIKK